MVEDRAEGGVLADVAEAFCEDGEFGAVEVVFLDGTPDEGFRDAVGVDVCCWGLIALEFRILIW